MSEPTETTDPQPPVDDSERVWEGSRGAVFEGSGFPIRDWDAVLV